MQFFLGGGSSSFCYSCWNPSLVSGEDSHVEGFSPRQRDYSSPKVFSFTPSCQAPDSIDGHSSMTFRNYSLADLSHISSNSHGQQVVDGLRLKPSNLSRAIFTYFSHIIYQSWLLVIYLNRRTSRNVYILFFIIKSGSHYHL